MKLRIFFISIFLAFVLQSAGLATLLGYMGNVTTVAFMPLISFLAWQHIKGRVLYKKNQCKPALLLIMWGVIMIIIGNLVNSTDYFKIVLTFLFIPYFLSIYLENIDTKERLILRKCVISIFILECVLALYERVTGNILLADEEVFHFMNSAGDTWSFRASALFGHPLANCMIVCTIIVFVMMSDSTIRCKFLILGVGLIGLFSFNERGNIIIILFVSFLYLLRVFKNGSNKLKRRFLFLLIPSIIISYEFLSTSEFGGRLFNMTMDKNESSTMARFEVFDAFNIISSDELLWGISDIDNILNALNLVALENGIVLMLLRYGLILAIPLLILLLNFQVCKLREVGIFNTCMCLFVFYGIGITNPHISSSLPWFTFICCYYAFGKSLQKTKIR